MGELHNLFIIFVRPQPIDVSHIYRRDLHETMQPRKLRSKWRILGGLKAGCGEGKSSKGEKHVSKDVEEAEETSSSHHKPPCYNKCYMCKTSSRARSRKSAE